MAKRKLIYDNWIAETGVDPHSQSLPEGWEESHISIDEVANVLIDPGTDNDHGTDLAVLRAEVRSAVAKLNEDERELVERIYFMGESLQELADKLGRRRHSLEALHRRCRKKLIRHLTQFVDQRWGAGLRTGVRCLVCDSPHRREIDLLIAERDRTLTWKPVLKAIRERFGLNAVTAQLLRGHEQYH